MDHSEMISTLNELIETSKDGQFGFETCADRASSTDLKQTFLRAAAGCASGATELYELVLEHGGEAKEGGTMAGAVRRGWVSLKDAVSGHSDLSLLEECERAEDVAIGLYRKALTKDLPPEVRKVVERQMLGVQVNHDQVRALRNDLKAHI